MTRKRISARERARLFALNKGTCHLCKGRIQVGEAWDISHDKPLEMGGTDDDENRKVAHRKCHRRHTADVDIPVIARAKRVADKHSGAKRPSGFWKPAGVRFDWRTGRYERTG